MAISGTRSGAVLTHADAKRSSKLGLFDLDSYTCADLVERVGVMKEVINRAAQEWDKSEGKRGLPNQNLRGHAGRRFTYAAVMWWMAGCPAPFDPQRFTRS